MGHQDVYGFNDQPLRDELVWAQMRLNVATRISKRTGCKRITVREFLEQAIQVELRGISIRDLVIIGDCFGLSEDAIRLETCVMIAEKCAALDQSYRFGLPFFQI